MNALERLFSRVARVMAYAGAIALLVMTALVVISSFMRYFVGRPFDFTEELVALLYMAMVFLAIPLVTLKQSHIAVSVLPQRVMRAFSGPLRAGSVLVMIAFCTWFTVEAYDFVEYARRLSSRSEQVDLLLWPWMAVIPVTMVFVTIVAAFLLFRGAPPPAPDEGKALPLGDGL
jgi:TRAP-type C4-dicarboxylate transport system permease small subunit